MGPTGSFDLVESAWSMKWSGAVTATPAGVIAGLADDAAAVVPNILTGRRYPFASAQTSTRLAVRTESDTLVGTTAIISVLKNGVVFASMDAPELGGFASILIPMTFASGDDIGIQIETTPGELAVGAIDVEAVVDFQGPSGPVGPTGPGGPVPIIAAAVVTAGGAPASSTGFSMISRLAAGIYSLTLLSPPPDAQTVVTVTPKRVSGTALGYATVMDGVIIVRTIAAAGFATDIPSDMQFSIIVALAEPPFI